MTSYDEILAHLSRPRATRDWPAAWFGSWANGDEATGRFEADPALAGLPATLRHALAGCDVFIDAIVASDLDDVERVPPEELGISVSWLSRASDYLPPWSSASAVARAWASNPDSIRTFELARRAASSYAAPGPGTFARPVPYGRLWVLYRSLDRAPVAAELARLAKAEAEAANRSHY